MNPCGQVVDFLRSCYTTDCVFTSGGAPLLSKIRWYRCAPGATFLGIPTAFASSVWDSSQTLNDSPVGEVRGADRPYYLGFRPGPLPGTHHEGSAEAWLNGLSQAELIAPAPPLTTDCQYTYVDCVNCPSGAALQYRLDVAGITGTGDAHLVNGSWVLNYVGACTWQSNTVPAGAPLNPGFAWRLVFRPEEVLVQLARIPGPISGTWDDSPISSCYNGRTVPLVSTIPAIDATTATVTYAPI